MRAMRGFYVGLILLTSALGQAPPAARNQEAVDSLRQRLDAIADDPSLARGFLGAKVISVETGQTLYERNAEKLFIPASNMKLITAVAATEILGLDYRFQTSLATNGQISDGVLNGDLVVIGGGDPTIGARWSSPDLERPQDGDPMAIFTSWAARLKALGIGRIRGSLRCDASVFSSSGLGAGWSWDDLAWGYAAPATGLPFNENVAWAEMSAPAPGSSFPIIRVRPEGAPLRVDNQLLVSEREETEISAEAVAPGVVRLSGVKNDRFPATRTLAVDDPASYFLHFLRQGLEDQGITIEGATGPGALGEEREKLTTLFFHESPDLRYVLRVLLKVSQNLYAETLLRKISPLAREKSPEDGISQVTQVLRRVGIGEGECVIADGSGLSRYNLVTPNALVTLLAYVYRQPYRDEFLGFLPVGGVDGTLRYRMGESPAAGHSQAKTGRLLHVRSLSGYVRTSDGETLVFSIMLNHFEPDPAGNVEKVIDAMVAAIAAKDEGGRMKEEERN